LTTARAIARERTIQITAVSGLLLLCALVVAAIEPVLISFVLAFVIHYLLAPLVNAAERSGLSRKLAVAALYMMMAVVAVAGATLLMPALATQLASLKTEMPALIDGTTDLLARSDNWVNGAMAGLTDLDFSSAAGRTLAALSARIIEGLPAFFSTLLTVLILAPFFAFFMLIDGRVMMKKLVAMVPNHLFEPALTLVHRVNVQLGGFIRARLLEAGIVATAVWIGLAAIGYPYSLLLGMFAGLMNLIPYIGPVIGAVPAMVIGPVMGIAGWKMGMVVGVYVAAQLIDMVFIIPLVVAKIINLHPVTVVIVVIVGAQLAGIVGMVISIPAACVAKLLTVSAYEHLVDCRR